MTTDNTAKLQNYIKRLARSAEEARELISKMVLIDWNAIYPAKQNIVVSTEPTEKIYAVSSLIAIADIHQEVGLSTELEKPTISNVVPVENVILDSSNVIADTRTSPYQAIAQPTR